MGIDLQERFNRAELRRLQAYQNLANKKSGEVTKPQPLNNNKITLPVYPMNQELAIARELHIIDTALELIDKSSRHYSALLTRKQYLESK